MSKVLYEYQFLDRLALFVGQLNDKVGRGETKGIHANPMPR